MTHSSAPPSKDEVARREPLLRIVSSQDTITSGVSGARQTWQGSAMRPHAVHLKQDAMLDRALQARIGGMLREVFSDLAEAPVPDRFVALLEALDQKEKSGE